MMEKKMDVLAHSKKKMMDSSGEKIFSQISFAVFTFFW